MNPLNFVNDQWFYIVLVCFAYNMIISRRMLFIHFLESKQSYMIVTMIATGPLGVILKIIGDMIEATNDLNLNKI